MEWLAVPVNSNNKWTLEEDKRLLELQAAGKSNFLIAAALRRSIGSVHGRLTVLKAKETFASNSDATRSMPRRKRWTLDDDKGLVELMAKGASPNEIANTLGRTGAAMKNRAHTLKHRAVARHLPDDGLRQRHR
jgi:DNA-binding CsgD family transcriptional regulator